MAAAPEGRKRRSHWGLSPLSRTRNRSRSIARRRASRLRRCSSRLARLVAYRSRVDLGSVGIRRARSEGPRPAPPFALSRCLGSVARPTRATTFAPGCSVAPGCGARRAAFGRSGAAPRRYPGRRGRYARGVGCLGGRIGDVGVIERGARRCGTFSDRLGRLFRRPTGEAPRQQSAQPGRRQVRPAPTRHSGGGVGWRRRCGRRRRALGSRLTLSVLGSPPGADNRVVRATGQIVGHRSSRTASVSQTMDARSNALRKLVEAAWSLVLAPIPGLVGARPIGIAHEEDARSEPDEDDDAEQRQRGGQQGARRAEAPIGRRHRQVEGIGIVQGRAFDQERRAIAKSLGPSSQRLARGRRLARAGRMARRRAITALIDAQVVPRCISRRLRR